ncbi:MAG: DUF389 domain-containing protein [Haloarculaceae archaeon]
MRQFTIRVADDRRAALTDALDDLDVDYVVLAGDGEMTDASVVEFPVPTDAVGDVLDALERASVDADAYTVIAGAETAMTPHTETLMDRYADDFDPLSRPELRSKARNLSRDATSFYALVVLASIIATAGLLLSSPAVIVGSMVIAPLVGPVLTASVGVVTGDRDMLVDSVRLQAIGLVVAVLAAAVVTAALARVAIVPVTLDLAALDPIASRIAPSFLSVLVGLTAGGAAAYGLATKGPTALIGVMIAAALIPAAAAVGVALAWNAPLLATGTALLLVASVTAINLGALAVLRFLGYRAPADSGGADPDGRGLARTVTAAVLAVVVLAAVVVGAVGTVQHVRFEQQTNRAVQSVVSADRYAGVGVVAVRPQYGGPDPFAAPKTVTIVLSRESDRPYAGLIDRLGERVAGAVDRDVTVRVRWVTYHQAGGSADGNP